jgi:mRNA-degrading endonuclease toxin of MazEF toxin-antitoxin module
MVQLEISTAKWSNSSAMKPVLVLSPKQLSAQTRVSDSSIGVCSILNRREADTELNNSPTSGVKKDSIRTDTGLELIMFINQ